MRVVLLLAAFLCSSCAVQQSDKPRQVGEDPLKILRCYEHGLAPGKFCRASMLQVISSRGLFEQRQVVVPGFLGDIDGDLYLFPSREFYLGRDLSSSVRLLGEPKLMEGNEGSNVIVFGTFTLDAPDPSTLMKPVGAISVLHVRNGYNKPDTESR